MNSSELILIEKAEKLFKIENEQDTIQFKINTISSYNNKAINTSFKEKDLKLVSQTELNIQNISNEFISFRIQSTKSKNYEINPSYCIISPKKIVNIKIYFYLQPKEKINQAEHKFKLEGFVIFSNEKNKEAKDLFMEYISKRKKVLGTVIKKNASFINEINMMDNYINNDFGNLNKYGEDKRVDEFEDLRIEYCKLKGINENLKLEYFTIKKRLDLELKEKNEKNVYSIQKNYESEKNNNYIYTKRFYIICFFASIALGFFLMK